MDHRRRAERDRPGRSATAAGRRLPAAARPPGANLNTATFDGDGILWFTGQAGIYGRLDPRRRARSRSSRRRAARARTASRRRPTARSGTRRSPAATSAHIDRRRARPTRHRAADAGPGRAPRLVGLAGPVWDQRVERGPGRRCTTPRPARGASGGCPGDASPQPYAVYVDDAATSSGSPTSAPTRSSASTPRPRRSPRSRCPTPDAAVRQLLGRPGEVWGAESAADKLVVVRTCR